MTVVAHSLKFEGWPEPDLSILRRDRPTPPAFPLDCLGPAWSDWVSSTAEAAACPPDYVAAPLLSAASALIGNARWAEATPGWVEPPHLWLGVVGDSGNGKSPGADCLMRDVLPEIERRMLADFPDRLQEWGAKIELGKAAIERWRRELREAEKRRDPLPPAPLLRLGPKPQAPRLRQHDVTVEKLAELLANTAPKGLLVVRDELAGWIAGMNAYGSGAGRAFWIEAHGGRPYRVERKADPNPIVVSRIAVAVYGGTQPNKLRRLLSDPDDGLLPRFLWLWPDPVPFRLGYQPPRTGWTVRALDRLRELDLQHGDPPLPIRVPLAAGARSLLESFAREMQQDQLDAGPLLAAALGKARGQALRLALVIELLTWCGQESALPPPSRISVPALSAAMELMRKYFLRMAERVYGDSNSITAYHDAATLARWIFAARPSELHIRYVQREGRLPGLRTANRIRQGAELLVLAGWLRPPVINRRFGPRDPYAYPVNPRLRHSAGTTSEL